MVLMEAAMAHRDSQEVVRQGLLLVLALAPFPEGVLQNLVGARGAALVPSERARFGAVPWVEHSALVALVVLGNGSQASLS